MDEVQRAIVRALRDDEEPLDVARQEAGEELGRDLEEREFADAISELLESDTVQLWHTDVRTGDRTELYVLPSLLGLDTVDPAELTLGLGPNAKKEGPPRWRIHVDIKHHTFLLEADVSAEKEAVRRMYHENPEVEFRIERRIVVDDRVRIEGSTHAKNRSE